MPDLKGKCFRCTPCGADFDESPAIGACNICEKVNCHDCMDEAGVCVPCNQLKQ